MAKTVAKLVAYLVEKWGVLMVENLVELKVEGKVVLWAELKVSKRAVRLGRLRARMLVESMDFVKVD